MEQQTWAKLQEQKIPAATLRNGAHMLEVKQQCEARFAGCQIAQDGLLWFLEAADGSRLSRSHTSHYACWVEALL